MRKTQPSLTDLRNGRLASKLGNQTRLKSSEILGNKSTSLATNFYLVPSILSLNKKATYHDLESVWCQSAFGLAALCPGSLVSLVLYVHKSRVSLNKKATYRDLASVWCQSGFGLAVLCRVSLVSLVLYVHKSRVSLNKKATHRNLGSISRHLFPVILSGRKVIMTVHWDEENTTKFDSFAEWKTCLPPNLVTRRA